MTYVEHDYRESTYGHDVEVQFIRQGGQWLEVSGVGLGIEPNHAIVLPTSDGQGTRYRVACIDYDTVYPGTHWDAILSFDPRGIALDGGAG